MVSMAVWDWDSTVAGRCMEGIIAATVITTTTQDMGREESLTKPACLPVTTGSVIISKGTRATEAGCRSRIGELLLNI